MNYFEVTAIADNQGRFFMLFITLLLANITCFGEFCHPITYRFRVLLDRFRHFDDFVDLFRFKSIENLQLSDFHFAKWTYI